jgi:hypothetical protein
MNITGLWANEGGDKVTQDELRVSKNTQNLTGKTINRTWDGNKISIFGARNEVVSFNLTLEAASQRATDVSVEFNTLTGPGGAKIASTGTDPLNWTNRPIELFYTRYLKINGLSFFGYAFEESQIPKRFRASSQQWNDRPDHDKMYPDPLVPMELVKKFNIAAGSESIHLGRYLHSENSRARGLPGHSEGARRRHRLAPDPGRAVGLQFRAPGSADQQDRHQSGLHGHHVALCGRQWRLCQLGLRCGPESPGRDGQILPVIPPTQARVDGGERIAQRRPADSSMPRLDGSLYTAANGYDGPGVNSPNDVFGIGIYGTWNFKDNQQ